MTRPLVVFGVLVLFVYLSGTDKFLRLKISKGKINVLNKKLTYNIIVIDDPQVEI